LRLILEYHFDRGFLLIRADKPSSAVDAVRKISPLRWIDIEKFFVLCYMASRFTIYSVLFFQMYVNFFNHS